MVIPQHDDVQCCVLCCSVGLCPPVNVSVPCRALISQSVSPDLCGLKKSQLSTKRTITVTTCFSRVQNDCSCNYRSQMGRALIKDSHSRLSLCPY